MKSKTNQITIIYVLIAVVLATFLYKATSLYFSAENYLLFHLIKDFILIILTGLAFRYILSKNENRNKTIFERLENTNSEIKESNQKYDIVAKATSDTIWDWKIPEDKLNWSKGIKAVFGYEEDQVGDNSSWWFGNIHPEDSIKMSIKLYSFIEQKTEKWQDEYRFKCADNTYKYVLDRGFLLKDENGKAIRMIGALQDVTKQKEEELRLKLLETVILQTKESIVITEATFNNNLFPKIIYVNPAFTNMTGYEPEEVINNTLGLLRGPNTQISVLKRIVQIIKNKEEGLLEIKCYKKDKTEFWLRFTIIPIYSSENELSHWVSIQRDVTEEKNQEKEKEQLIKELTQNNKDLKQFSYITSHNLRAPMSNLTGLLNLIEDINIEDTELKEIIQGFNKSTHLLNETIDDLTKVMIIKDNTVIEKENLSLREVFENVFNQLTTQIEIHKPILKLDLDKVSILNTNKAYLESILLNLLTNSLKYKSNDRILKITITAHQTDNNTVQLIFKDNGIGIDLEKNRDKIFGLYQRFHDYPDSKGLGLYLVKSQVEAMKGTISIESQVNKGTTITLTFKN
ncbi:PAS domain S-box-containing protein [Flavobacterium flevense]|uniref:histidine kinase n=1 Tax=Flavobacterium flevense TaxID=983 RepID=A0A4Y4B0G5_9FLAO|nr:PAS domain-containing sensor histidine kinase [Flavobacterium flevense]GEC72627.1 histidine kinase [Flavobacterium flevense]SHL81839.1 PAS domain S-box-containing protein [Flavobacterium flevense]